MGFIRYYHKERYPVKLLGKQQSWLMKAVNFILVIASKVKLASIDKFMGGYVTTIGKRIYASPAWTLDMKASPIVVHELTHVEQWSFMYALKYIFSSKYRARVESICMQAEMMCFPDRFQYGGALESRAMKLVDYGIPFWVSIKELNDRRLEINNGSAKKPARIVLGLFNAWKREYPNEV